MLHIKYAEQLNNQNIYDHIHRHRHGHGHRHRHGHGAIHDNMICLFLH
jgi:hypothetical protein